MSSWHWVKKSLSFACIFFLSLNALAADFSAPNKNCVRSLAIFFANNPSLDFSRSDLRKVPQNTVGSSIEFGMYVKPLSMEGPYDRVLEPFRISKDGSVLDYVGSPHFTAKKTFLYLSEGSAPNSTARRLSKKLTDRSFTITDSSYPRETRLSDNLIAVYVNNEETLPFRDNSFDIIIQQKGLCACSRENTIFSTCGGVPVSVEGMSFYFQEIYRVLNKKIPHSFALLHGGLHTEADKVVLDTLMAAARECMRRNPKIQIDLIFMDTKDEVTNVDNLMAFFWGLKIYERTPSF